MVVTALSLRDFRSYDRLELELEPGVVLVVGENGAGKTNLLEALHVGTQGFSPRTHAHGQLIRFGRASARVLLRGEQGPGGAPLELELVLRAGGGKEARRNGALLRAAEHLRGETTTLVFTPDRLAVVKGGPAVRRAYLDRALARLRPSRAGASHEYASTLGQRNAALRRVRLGLSSREALEPWTERLSALGSVLVEARREALALLAPAFAEVAGELGLEAATVAYVGEPVSAADLQARLDRDLERGTTGSGPHLDDVEIAADGRDLRRFGSQGEQRLAVLSLLLAEADVLRELRGEPPLLLLDDVLSELDPGRRAVLVERIGGRGQTLVTATTAAALPGAPDLLLEVSPGVVRRAA